MTEQTAHLKQTGQSVACQPSSCSQSSIAWISNEKKNETPLMIIICGAVTLYLFCILRFTVNFYLHIFFCYQHLKYKVVVTQSCLFKTGTSVKKSYIFTCQHIKKRKKSYSTENYWIKSIKSYQRSPSVFLSFYSFCKITVNRVSQCWRKGSTERCCLRKCIKISLSQSC